MDPFQLSETYVDAMADLWPVTATFQGLPGRDGAWNDYSPDGVGRARATLLNFRTQLRELPPSSDRWQCLAADFMGDMIERNLLFYGTDDCLRDLNSIDCPLQHMRMIFDVMAKDTPEGRENIRKRLDTLPQGMASYRTLLESGRQSGHVVSRRQVLTGIEQARMHAGPRSSFHAMDFPETEKARAAFADIAEYLEREYLPSAVERDAVGRERYSREVRRFLGADVNLEDTYVWGWDQVRSILAEMTETARLISADEPLPEVLDILNTDPARASATLEEFLDLMRERQARALADLDGSHFDVPPEIRRVDVKEAPPGGPIGAYYIPPSEDFSRSGSIWYSVGAIRPIPIWDHVSTAYHEGFPGHHLQIGIQMSLRDRLSKLQRLDGYSGYAEGWALYTELLMRDLGYYEKPDYLLGMLSCQMIRACRVVIDIGSHLELPIPDDAPFHPGKRWTYDLAVEMLEKMAGMQADHARSEVIRYLGWPAQAISYKVGERLILELRDALKKSQGPAFRLKDFHARVLGCGNVALARLKNIVLETAPQ